MKPERWEKVIDLFQSALEHAPEERAAFLDESCHDDEGMRREVESLLISHQRAENFIEVPAFKAAPEFVPNDSADALVGKLIGHYRIESLIGVGGMGEVYLARDERLGRKAAVKLLPDSLTTDDTQLSRFKNEARTASALNHPNILTVYEIGAEGDVRFIATEFIEGITLRAALASGRMSVQKALEIAVQVASALAAAHEAGIVHRDIKPENIMLRPDGFVKVLDFGIAKLIERMRASDGDTIETTALLQTGPGLVLGTACYMSPEQARGQKVDARSDIWSLGVVLYEMVTGSPPFRGETSSDCIAAILTAEPVPLSSVSPDVPAKLESILQRALRKNTDERYQTTKEMLAELGKLKAKLEAGSSLSQIKSVHDRNASEIKRPRLGVLVTIVSALLAAVAVACFFFFVAPAPSANEKSIAVLPFENLSEDKSNAYFADGIQDEILTRLSKIADLKVISRTSTEKYKSKPDNLREIARQLGVSNILEGSVQKAADQVRVSVQLINATTDGHLWAEIYDRKLTDIFKVESDIAKTVAETLQAKLTGSEEHAIFVKPTADAAAYQLYLKGRFLFGRRSGDNIPKAIEYFEEAIRQDPNYALAYAGLAEAWITLPGHASARLQDVKPKAKEAALKSLQIDDTLAAAHTALAQVLFFDLDFAGAIKEFQRAIDLDPNYATAHHWYANGPLLALGRFDEAIAEGARAVELDPLSPIINVNQANNYIIAGRYDEAIHQIRKALELDPEFGYAHTNLGLALELKGDLPGAIAEFRRAHQLNGNPLSLAYLGNLYGKTGNVTEAANILTELEQLTKTKYVSAHAFALVQAGLGNRAEALRWLEKSYADRSQDIAYIKVDWLLDPLRDDPGFQNLVGRVVPTRSANEKSIAVLPFENLSEDKSNAYFADGIQDEILTRLSKIADLKVISRTSTQRYQKTHQKPSEIAKQLDVANLLEGSVQKTNDQVRVNVQLIKAANDSHLWAETFDRRLTDIFSVESEIAKAIADRLQANLTGREEQALTVKSTNNPEAYDAYLRGLAFEGRNTVSNYSTDLSRKAIGFYERAVQLDPNFAIAWARLSRADARLYFNRGDAADATRGGTAKQALDSAQKLEPNSPETLLALGYYQYLVQRDYRSARTTFESVSKMLPGSSEVAEALGAIARREGQWDQSIAYFEQALALDPRNVELLMDAAWTYAMLRQFPPVLKLYDRVLDITPRDPDAMASKAAIYQAKGNLEDAARLLSGVNEQTSNEQTFTVKINQLRLEHNYAEAVRLLQARLAEFHFASQFDKGYEQVALALTRRLAGDKSGAEVAAEDARNTLEQLYRDQPDNVAFAARLSQAYAATGQNDLALKLAERAIMLVPRTLDQVSGPTCEENLALIQTSSGEKSHAISTLTELSQTPYNSWIYGAVPITPALLRLDPIWDSLRSDPAFGKLHEKNQP